MKKLLIAILAVAALSHANQCEDLAEIHIDDMKNCKLHYSDDDQVRFKCSNGIVVLMHKNDNARYLGIMKDLNMNESEFFVIKDSNCFITHKDKYGVLEHKFQSTDVESNATLNLWGYFKRHLVR